MTLWPLVFVISTAVAAIGFVFVAILWLRKLRETVGNAIGETAGQQLRSSQRLHDKLSRLQTQQMLYEDRLEDLTAANNQLRKELHHLKGQTRSTEKEAEKPSRLLH